MAQAGLNDTKLRQQMEPAEREAYVQVLNSVEVMRLDRGSSKSVRAVLMVAPEAWARLSGGAATLQNPQPAGGKETPASNKAPALNGKKNGGPKQAARRP
jgi:hypothetical protein